MNKLPKISMREIGKEYHYRYEVTVDQEEWYKEICDKARQEIPDEEIFNWWMNQALRETVERIESQTPIQSFGWKLKIKLMRLFGRI